MRKLRISMILMSISMLLAGCNNEQVINKNVASNKITVDEAKEIALKDANLPSDNVSFIRADTEVDNGVEKYNIEFYYEDKEYDYEINANDGSIIESDFDVENYNTSQEQSGNSNSNTSSSANTISTISAEKAKEIALNHAGLTSDKVTFIRSNIEVDDGVERYNVEFYHENKEYDYEINANDGSIIEYDFDVENYNISQEQSESGNSNSNTSSSTNTASTISAEKAKEIALNHAGLTSDKVTFIRSNIEVDDGIKKYNVEFYYENKEYDYEINATNGSIMEYDFDAESYNISQGQSGSGNSNSNSNSNVNTVSISVEKAKEIALNHAGLTSDKVKVGKTELDFDDGIQKYEVEFYYNNKEYSYEIDANTGSILAYERD